MFYFQINRALLIYPVGIRSLVSTQLVNEIFIVLRVTSSGYSSNTGKVREISKLRLMSVILFDFCGNSRSRAN